MGRGGHRDGAGRKSGWNHSETQTIRVPKVFAAQLMNIARQLDSDNGIPGIEDESLNQFDYETISEESQSSEVVPGQISIFDVIDSVSESKVTSLKGADLDKYLGLDSGQVSRMKGRFKGDPQKFIEWSRTREKKMGLPVIGWRYNEMTKVYDSIEDF
jgi:hypothetical protein